MVSVALSSLAAKLPMTAGGIGVGAGVGVGVPEPSPPPCAPLPVPSPAPVMLPVPSPVPVEVPVPSPGEPNDPRQPPSKLAAKAIGRMEYLRRIGAPLAFGVRRSHFKLRASEKPHLCARYKRGQMTSVGLRNPPLGGETPHPTGKLRLHCLTRGGQLPSGN